MLRIALLLESDQSGGAEVMTLRLGRELEVRGHDVHFVGPAPGDGWLADQFRQDGTPTSCVPFRRAIDWGVFSRLRGILRTIRPDVIHSHQFAFAVYGAAVARWLKVPHVITMHGNPDITTAWRRRAALRWAIRRSAATVAVSEATRREFIAALGQGIPPLAMIPNGVPLPTGSADSIQAEFRLGDQPLLLAVGNLLPVKGHIVLLHALAELADRPWRLIIVGRHDAATAELRDFIAARGWGERVLLPGTRDDVGAFLGAASVFVMPSRWEGLPLALLEAMRAGLPIIASGVAGIPEAIDDGVEGLLVSADDAPALARALRRILDDSVLRQQLGASARARSERDFSIEAMTDRYLGLYSRVSGT